MDPNLKSSSVLFNFPPGSADFPFDGFPLFQSDFPAESGGAELDEVAVTQPLECLQQGNLIPPFLMKTYDLVEDPSLDPIISWSETGDSFVPKWGSFGILQGFCKNKWEFGNEFFRHGSKHLLKNIQRRKSSHPQQVAVEGSRPETETELEKLRTEKSLMMEELVELQQQHRKTSECMEKLKQRLQDSEKRQKQMVSLVVEVVQNPEFIESVMEMKEQRLMDCSPRTRRKFAKQKTQEQEVVSSEMRSSLTRNYALQENMPKFQSENVSPVQIGGGDSNSDNGEFSSIEFGHSVDFPEELVTDKAFTEIQYPDNKKEEILKMGFDFNSSMVDSWSNGAFFSDGHLDTLYSYEMQGIGISEVENWQYDESPVGLWE